MCSREYNQTSPPFEISYPADAPLLAGLCCDDTRSNRAWMCLWLEGPEYVELDFRAKQAWMCLWLEGPEYVELDFGDFCIIATRQPKKTL
jgi:hypothetical protein